MYTITDVNSLKVKLLLIMGVSAFVFALIFLFLTMMIPYNLTIKKQKDVFFRRVEFFGGMVSLFSAMLLFIGEFLIRGWEPNMDPDYSMNIVGNLLSFVLIASIVALVIYVATFWLVARFLRSIVGYKPWTVFVSNGKIFGLF
jgi:hypothetical protein